MGDENMEYGILIDTTLCVGCYECEHACAERWGFERDPEVHKLSSTSNTAILTVDDVYVPRMCMHCEDPTCASVCPVAAFQKTPEGAVVYDADLCMGCRYCMQACPFDVPRYQWSSLNPKVTKCDMCHERVLAGNKPACVEACPTEARIFGPLEEIITLAKKRLEENPDTYYPKMYGLREAGGASVLYLSARPFEQLGLRTNLPDHPLPDLTWAVMSKIPDYVFWGGTLLAGIWWITNRRAEVAAYERKLKEMEERNPSQRHQNGGNGRE
jgi:formate dehydrogenase iron-sulfur subunit